MSDGAPKLFTAALLASAWGQLAMDYNDKSADGVRMLRRLSSIADTQAGIRRASRTAKKRGGSPKPLWKYPKTCAMEDEGA